jgi:hypothetical protein
MSRRFGRNQKRALRRQLEEMTRERDFAERVAWRCQAEVVRVQRDRDSLDRGLRLCKEALGAEFVGFSPVDAAMRARAFYHEDGFRVDVPGNGVQHMHVLRTDAWADTLDPLHHIHFRVELAGGDVAYCVSEAALRRVPERVLAEQIAAELAPFLLKSIRSKRHA